MASMLGTENMAVPAAAKVSKVSKKSKAPLATVNGDDDTEERLIGGRNVEDIYQKKSQIEHILLRPDTYIGSIVRSEQEMWVHDEETPSIVKKHISYVPGLYKIFDEIIVNAADNKQRDSNMTKLKVDLDARAGSIKVWNNGKGIPIVMHKTENCYVPELIFGHLLTGSNFDDDQKKTTGGRNGYGAKLANIFSTEFIVETADAAAGKHYKQIFSSNMSEKSEPEITAYSGSEFTCITFKPDWTRFNMKGLEADTEALLRKRVHDIAGCMSGYGGKRVKVYLNSKVLEVNNFKDYLDMYEGMEPIAVHESVGGWDVAVGPSDGQFQQVSFVNAICTIKGGNHVSFIADQVVAHLTKVIKKKDKGADVKPHHIRNHLNICVNALVENPAFESQSKESLNTKPAAFGGSEVKLSDKTLKAIEKSSVVNSILSWCRFQAEKGLSKKSGKKTSKLTGITKLDDANFAGTAKSKDCTLILTEGDSAKTLAVSGLGVVGRDYYGVFPLKGKLLNVRDHNLSQVSKNEEITNVVRILGLKFGEDYTDTNKLRYGHLMIMTDQDHDGSHIKGLVINFIHKFWPSLLKIEGFLLEFITPIVKCLKGKQELCFYTVPEYETWREEHNGGKGWVMKYYKGLGTSTAKEAKEYFANIATHQIPFDWQDDDKDTDLIDLAFSKTRAEDRKTWLRGYRPGTYVDYSVESMTYDSFINDEFILFSMQDNKRSLPSLVDGFKPSQRKVLFACFKRKLKAEIKVAQLAGYVSEHSAYHHGEASLTGTIVNMAQTFCGSNNITLLTPGGQFGSRLMGGKDAASARYIFTKLERIARAVFHPDDDAVLTYLDDDGMSIEPEFFVPVLPMVLVNGIEGIGTGWSCSVPNYSPRDVLENLRRLIRGEPLLEMQPWYRGFVGEIQKKAEKAGKVSFSAQGIIERTGDDTLEITELPVKKWTTEYKAFLEGMLPGAEEAKAKGAKGGAKGGAKPKPKKKAAKDAEPEDDDDEEAAGTKGKAAKLKVAIKDFRENHTDTTVHFTVTLAPEDIDLIEAQPGGLRKHFKLDSSISTSNMVLFDEAGAIAKFNSPLQVMSEFYALRLRYYDLRKAHLLSRLQREWSRLDNKVRFVLAVVNGTLEVRNRKKTDLLQQLKSDGFAPLLPEAGANGKAKVKPAAASSASEDDEPADGSGSDSESEGSSSGETAVLAKGYDYLLGMKLWTLTKEMVAKLEKELEAKLKELTTLRETSVQQLWLRDLDAVSEALDECDAAHIQNARAESKQRKAAGRGGAGGGQRKNGSRKRSADDADDDSDFESAGKKKAKKQQQRSNGPPVNLVVPPTPAAHARTTETVLPDGTRVSTAFAEALQEGRFGSIPMRADGAAGADDELDDEADTSMEVVDADAAAAGDSDAEDAAVIAQNLATAKAAAAKARLHAKAAAGAAAVTTALAAAVKAKPARKPKQAAAAAAPAFDNSDDEDKEGGLSFIARLQLKYAKTDTSAAAGDEFDYLDESEDADMIVDTLPAAKATKPAKKAAAVKKPTAVAAAKKKPATANPKPAVQSIDSDSDDNNDDDEDDAMQVVSPTDAAAAEKSKTPVPRRAAAAAATKKVAATVLSSDEEDGTAHNSNSKEDSDSDAAGGEGDSFSYDSSDGSYFGDSPKKKQPAKKAAPVKKAAAVSKAAVKPKATAKPKPVKKAAGAAAKKQADSDGDDSDVEVVESPPKKKAAAAVKKTAAAAAGSSKAKKAPVAKKLTKKAAAAAADSDADSDSDGSPVKKPAAKKAAAKPVAKAPAKAAAKKAPAKKAPAAKKAKKAAAADSSDDDNESEDDIGSTPVAVQPRATRPGRARAAVSYVDLAGDDEDEQQNGANSDSDDSGGASDGSDSDA